MSYQLLVTLLSYSFGFVAAVCFAFASAFSSTETLANMCKTYWVANMEYAKEVVAQSVQYIIGSILLFFSFLLQVLASLLPDIKFSVSYPVWLFSFFVISVTLILLPIVSACTFKILFKKKFNAVALLLKPVESKP
jgi:hypothetical protein